MMVDWFHLHAIAHISDLHIGASPEHTFATQRVCDAILASDIQTVLVTGDITSHGSVEEFNTFLRISAPLRAARSVLLLPGNHDHSRTNIIHAMMDGEQVTMAMHDGVAIVRLDTTNWYNRFTFMSHGNISRAMCRDVDQLLDSVPEKTFVIVALHHHPLPLPADRALEYLSTWFSLPFAKHLSTGSRFLERLKGRCDVVLHGHRHAPAAMIFPFAQRPLSVYNAGSSSVLGAFRRFDIDQGRLVQRPEWISV